MDQIFIRTTFYIQEPISPVYMVTDESTALEGL